MTHFWLPIIALCALAAAFVIWPLWRGRHARREQANADTERLALNVEIFRDRQAELQQDLDAGRITTEERDALELELERNLLVDAETMRDGSQGRAHLGGFAMLAVFVMLMGGTYWWYAQQGSLDALKQAQAMRFSEADMAEARAAAEQGDMNALIEQLYGKLKQAPDNMEGWSLLARSAMNMERYDLAEDAYRNLIRLSEQQDANPAPIYGLLAQAQYFGNGGVMTTAVNDALNKALTLDAGESNALGLKAIHAFEQAQYREAARLWQQIVRLNPDHPARSSIEAGITRARHLSGDFASGPPSDDLANAEKIGARIQVAVDLAPELKANLSGNERVFIFARAVSGPPMPVAASKHSVADLPVTIMLDDSKAMSPAVTLSSVEQVNVVARISKSGDPIAQPGDLEGSAESIATRTGERVAITIDRQL